MLLKCTPRKVKSIDIFWILLFSQELFSWSARISPFSTKSESWSSSAPLQMLQRKVHHDRLLFLFFVTIPCLNMVLFLHYSQISIRRLIFWWKGHGELPGCIQTDFLVQHTAAGNLTTRWNHAMTTSALTTLLWQHGWETAPHCFWTVEHDSTPALH